MKPEESSLFADLLEEGEEWLMRRILHYAILHDYTRFTSTAEEAWRASIGGGSFGRRSYFFHPDTDSHLPESVR